MKLILYMYKKFFAIFLGSLFFFVLVLCMTDLFINLWNYVSKNASALQVFTILFYYVPKAIWYAVPIAMLFATAYMLSDFYAKNELLAIFASGISLFRFTAPLLIVAIAMSFALFFFEDNLVVPTYSKKVKLQQQVLHKEKSLDNDRIVIMTEEGNLIYKVDHYEANGNRLVGLFVFFRNSDKTFDCLIYAESAVWEDGIWRLRNAKKYSAKETGDKKVLFLSSVDKEHSSRLVEPPETFRNNTLSVEEVNTKEAREYIAHLEKAGLPSGEERSLYYKKYAFPFVVFIVVFLAIGLSGKTRKNVLLISLALSITAVVLFYIIQMITMLMARFGTIPPLFGAWFPVFLFIVISCILLRYAKT